MQIMWKNVFYILRVKSTWKSTLWRKTFWVWDLWKSIFTTFNSEKASWNSYQKERFCLPSMWERVQTKIPFETSFQRLLQEAYIIIWQKFHFHIIFRKNTYFWKRVLTKSTYHYFIFRKDFYNVKTIKPRKLPVTFF